MKKIVFFMLLGASTAPAQPRFTIGRDGIVHRSADGSVDLRMAGYVQTDARNVEGIAGEPGDSLLFRRVRPTLSGTLFHRFEFRVAPEFGRGSPVLYDASVDAHFRYFTLRTGKFRAPFALERLQSAQDMTFIERGLPSELAPNRDWGVQVSKDFPGRRLLAEAGVFQGASDNALIDAGNNDGVDVVARIFATPWRSLSAPSGASGRALSGLGFGLGITGGEHHGTTLASYRTFGQSTFFSLADGVALAGRRIRYSPQAHYYAGPLGLLAEYIRTEQVMAANGVATNVSNSAWQVGGSWMLTGEAKTYRGVEPARPLVSHRGWGALEAVARVGSMHLDPVMRERGLTTLPTTAAREWVVGANWYVTHNVRASVNYAHTGFVTAAGMNPRPAERAVLGRIQLAF